MDCYKALLTLRGAGTRSGRNDCGLRQVVQAQSPAQAPLGCADSEAHLLRAGTLISLSILRSPVLGLSKLYMRLLISSLRYRCGKLQPRQVMQLDQYHTDVKCQLDPLWDRQCVSLMLTLMPLFYQPHGILPRTKEIMVLREFHRS